MDGAEFCGRTCLLTAEHADAMHKYLPYTRPTLLGEGPSIGMGDRLGLATPGHIRAVRDSAFRPVLAQQSVRELKRSKRDMQDVLAAATWGVLQTGYRGGFASDADHLRTPTDLELTADAEFTMFTLDPGAHVDTSADRCSAQELLLRLEVLPWSALRATRADYQRWYGGSKFAADRAAPGMGPTFQGEGLLRAAVKYGRAVAHVFGMYQRLVSMRARHTSALELSVDESNSATSAADHLFVVSELNRLGVCLDSFAPRLVGEFNKGVEYVGDLKALHACVTRHVDLARRLGNYKLSLHSGSDKFSIYPLVREVAGDRLHVKTSGTSYLEALRVIAEVEPDLFRQILRFAGEHFTVDRSEYHVNVDPENAPDAEEVADDELPGILDQRDVRQMCHVTFGSVLTARAPDGAVLFRERLLSALETHEEAYAQRLESHFRNHLEALA